MANLTLRTKTIRVSYCDPDATDSSSDDESDKSQNKSKRKVNEFEVEFVEKNQNEGTTGFKKPNLTREGEKIVGIRKTKSGKFWAEIKDPIKKRWVWLGIFATAEAASRAYLAEESKFAAAKLRAKQPVPKTAGKKILGVRIRKSGKFCAEIRNPITKRLWLGTFDTEEEASRAYLAKKAQFEVEQLRAKRRIDWVASDKSTIQDSVSSFHEGARTRISGVRRRNSGKFWAEITNPITKRRVWIVSFATEEEASRAYLAKEAGFEDELRAKQGFGKVASEKSSAPDSVSSVLEIETSDLSNETGVALSAGDQEAEFGFFNGVRVVDKNGFLVGEFSTLDDLSIFSVKEDILKWVSLPDI